MGSNIAPTLAHNPNMATAFVTNILVELLQVLAHVGDEILELLHSLARTLRPRALAMTPRDAHLPQMCGGHANDWAERWPLGYLRPRASRSPRLSWQNWRPLSWQSYWSGCGGVGWPRGMSALQSRHVLRHAQFAHVQPGQSRGSWFSRSPEQLV